MTTISYLIYNTYVSLFSVFVKLYELIMNTVNVFDCIINKCKSENLYRLWTSILVKTNNIVSIVRKKTEGAGERFSNIMMKLSIIKLSAAMVTLIVMAVLLYTNLHVLDPITLQFSKWVSTPIMGFIILIVAIKFAAISIGLTLTIMSVKKITFESMRLRLIEFCMLRLSTFFRRKEHFQRA